MTNWYHKTLSQRINRLKIPSTDSRHLWTQCKGCQFSILYTDLMQNMQVCPRCQYHHYFSARQRLHSLIDNPEEIGSEIRAQDKLQFHDLKPYPERIQDSMKRSKETEALIVAKGRMENKEVVLSIFEFAFMGGSMGQALGDRFIQGIQTALKFTLPFITITTSGGARMQEGFFSLYQMARTSAMLYQLHQKHLPYIVILTHPTFGGVSASLATLGDIILAEPQALIGFSGPRVIEKTMGTVLPPGFQRSEHLLSCGAIDEIVHRQELKQKLLSMLSIFYP